MAIPSSVWLAATILGVVLASMVLLWLISLYCRDASVVDPAWGAGFVLIAWITHVAMDSSDTRAWLLIAMTTVWGARLSLYLLWRNRGHGEDRRYRAMRDRHGASFWLISLFTVFLLQGLLMWFISWPVLFGQLVSRGSLNAFDFLGLLLWSVGLFFETVADYQLARPVGELFGRRCA